MKMLEKLPEDVQRLIISLPYRVGCFISASDQSGGDSADVAEQNALRKLLSDSKLIDFFDNCIKFPVVN